MSPIVLTAAAAVAGSLVVLGWLVLSGSAVRRQVAGNLGTRLGERGSSRPPPPPGYVTALAGQTRRLVPAEQISGLERRIAEAGRSTTMTVDRALASKGLGLLTGLALGGWLWLLSPSVSRLLLWGLIAAAGFWVLDLYLLHLAQARSQAIELALPDTLDQMTIAVQAGLGFDAAMLRIARSNRGPLAMEFAIAQYETRLGVPRSKALRRMAERSSCTDLRRFVSAISQSESYGIPIADILTVQAGELRQKRRQRAEERALKIPVKIIFPVVLCILPSLFVVLLGPAAIRIFRELQF